MNVLREARQALILRLQVRELHMRMEDAMRAQFDKARCSPITPAATQAGQNYFARAWRAQLDRSMLRGELVLDEHDKVKRN